jgi:hypothetical protein
MDLSKLPRLSETDKHTPPPAPPGQDQQLPPTLNPQPVPQQVYRNYDPGADGGIGMGMGAQIWLSAILGIVFMLMGWNFARFVIAKATGQPFNTNATWTSGPKAGQPVEYFELAGYTAYTDTAIFLFGLACVLEAIALAFAARNTGTSRMIVTTALALTVGMVIFNLIVAFLLFSSGIMPLASILAIAFGGWMAMFEYQLLRQMLATAPATAG